MQEAQIQSELKFWKHFGSQLCEIDKQTFTATLMGLPFDKNPYTYDLKGTSVLELGAGPCGISLRCCNGKLKVIEPIPYPQWVSMRYKDQDIKLEQTRIEDMQEAGWDEVWVHNVLQHVDDLDLCLDKIMASASKIRIFEWLDIPPDGIDHKHCLTKQLLDQKLGINGQTTYIQRPYMYQTNAYHGVYPLNNTRLERKWGGDLHRAMIHYIKETRGQGGIGCELGVLAGQHARMILDILKPDTLYLIDKYLPIDTDIYTTTDLRQARLSAYQVTSGENVEWVHLWDDDAFDYFRENNIVLDWCYLDANHTKDKVLKNITDAKSVVKSNGVIGGHDYIEDIIETNRVRQVKSAVQQYCKEQNVKYYSSDFSYSDWWIDRIENPQW